MSNTETLKQVAEKRKAHRRAIWNRIKAEAPDCAEMIELIAARYGKPEELTVTFHTGEVLNPSAYDKGCG